MRRHDNTRRKEGGKFQVERHFICVILDGNVRRRKSQRCVGKLLTLTYYNVYSRSTVALDEYERGRVGEEETPFCECLLR